jgi:hypothetical protein
MSNKSLLVQPLFAKLKRVTVHDKNRDSGGLSTEAIQSRAGGAAGSFSNVQAVSVMAEIEDSIGTKESFIASPSVEPGLAKRKVTYQRVSLDAIEELNLYRASQEGDEGNLFCP